MGASESPTVAAPRHFKRIAVIGWGCVALAWCCQAEDLVPLKIKLPAPAFVGTPSDSPDSPTVEKPSGVPRPLLMVPPGVRNVALKKPVTTSDTNQVPENLVKITDGDKEASEEGTVLLRKGVQWVQIDLGSPYEITQSSSGTRTTLRRSIMEWWRKLPTTRSSRRMCGRSSTMTRATRTGLGPGQIANILKQTKAN